MASRRQQRIEVLLKAEIGNIIRREMSDIITSFMSITDVEVSKDFSVAKVYVSFLSNRDSEKTLESLEKAGGFIRSELNKVLRMRRIPRLIFRRDETIAKAFKLEEVFEKIHSNESGTSDDSEED
jgi:ribosome-binding factor A